MLPRLLGILADGLWECGAFLYKDRSPDGLGFRLNLHDSRPDAPLSPFFINLRTPEHPNSGPLRAGNVALAGNLLWQRASSSEFCARGHRFDRVIGAPRAGEPFADCMVAASLITGHRDYHDITLLRAGSNGQIFGDFSRDERVLLVDGCLTEARSKTSFIDRLTQAGLIVSDVLVIIDREQGGRRCLEARGVRVTALMTISQLLDYYRIRHFIPPETYEELIRYVEEQRELSFIAQHLGRVAQN